MPKSSRAPNPVFSEAYGALRATIADARRAAGLTQRQVAARLGKSPSHVAMIERGQRRIDTLEMYRLALVLDLPPAEFFDRIVRRIEAFEASAPRHRGVGPT